ncbi:hypothetical protein H4217_003316 [Coemansia sp. RSA 1939]|nr:hypothetical protein H4217_003316 [Coemansia sp. RSA 1939]
MASGEISLFKLTTSLGNSVEQPIRPGERFSGVFVVQLDRPIQATQIVLTFAGKERRNTGPDVGSATEETEYFTADLTIWKALQKGPRASTVLSDGLHTFNFTCQMPHLNYPQSLRQPQCTIVYTLSVRLFSPKSDGSECVAAQAKNEMFITPLVTALPAAQPPSMAETLFFERKGKKGKPAIELRIGLSSDHIVPGTKLKIDMSIKELSSSNWTQVIIKLFERTRCRDAAAASFAKPVWSSDRILAQASHVRPAVFDFFVSDSVMEKNGLTKESKKGKGEPVYTESVTLPIPVTMCSPLSSENLEFTHFLRMEVVVPGWLSSERFVYTDIPVQLLAYGINSVARILHRRGSVASVERRGTESDVNSIISGRSSGSNSFQRTSQDSTERQIVSLTAEGKAAVMSALPPRYCDVHEAQRPPPSLDLISQTSSGAEADNSQEESDMQRISQSSQNVNNRQTMSSTNSCDYRSTISSTAGTVIDAVEEKYRTKQLPALPPLPLAPMPTSAYSIKSEAIAAPGGAVSQFLSTKDDESLDHNASMPSLKPNKMELQLPSPSQQHAHNDDDGLALSPITSERTLRDSDLTAVQQGFGSLSIRSSIQSTDNDSQAKGLTGGLVGLFKAPMSPTYTDSMTAAAGVGNDDDAGYFRSFSARKSTERERPSERSLFRLRKNSSIKQPR